KKWPREYSERDLKNIWDQDQLLSAHSSRIVILEGGKPLSRAKILATGKVSMEGDFQQGLALEQFTFSHLNYEFPLRHWRYIIPTSQDSETGKVIALRPQLVGGVAQIMGFANIGSPDLAALGHIAILDYALRSTQALPEVYLDPSLQKQ